MDHKLCSQCKGFCCEDIGLSVSPEEIRNSYQQWTRRAEEGNRDASMSFGTSKNVVYYDIFLTYPMLVHLHSDNIHPDGEIKTDQKVHHYRCKHHDQRTNKCSIYEERPMMCRTFPDNGFCGYRKVRNKKVIGYRPAWFKFGMTQEEWTNGVHSKVEKDSPTQVEASPEHEKADGIIEVVSR